MTRDEAAALWGDEAWERCPFCQETYTYELEVRCVDCDRPVCPVCTVHVRERRELHCPECRSDDAATSTEKES